MSCQTPEWRSSASCWVKEEARAARGLLHPNIGWCSLHACPVDSQLLGYGKFNETFDKVISVLLPGFGGAKFAWEGGVAVSPC